ncbi:Uncharacterised protein [Mycobacteroides abscessus subsp. abscessus]|uniref:hypothetical protein n=1 Tax=Mycobacteroides abscessus TaxID=36809 RepID=UPI000929C066|nr:hypothetical protein [Mycobacteroides abscessus]SIH35631.1 Uncharacterised protein [Mycobacteroides abscessus subsp. abscessus]
MFRVTKLAPTPPMKVLHGVLCLMAVVSAALAVAFASYGPAGHWRMPQGPGAFVTVVAIIGTLCNVLAFAVIMKPPSDVVARVVVAVCGFWVLAASGLFVRSLFGPFAVEGWLPALMWAPIAAVIFLAQLARLTDLDLPKNLRHYLNP